MQIMKVLKAFKKKMRKIKQKNNNWKNKVC